MSLTIRRALIWSYDGEYSSKSHSRWRRTFNRQCIRRERYKGRKLIEASIRQMEDEYHDALMQLMEFDDDDYGDGFNYIDYENWDDSFPIVSDDDYEDPSLSWYDDQDWFDDYQPRYTSHEVTRPTPTGSFGADPGISLGDLLGQALKAREKENARI